MPIERVVIAQDRLAHRAHSTGSVARGDDRGDHQERAPGEHPGRGPLAEQHRRERDPVDRLERGHDARRVRRHRGERRDEQRVRERGAGDAEHDDERQVAHRRQDASRRARAPAARGTPRRTRSATARSRAPDAAARSGGCARRATRTWRPRRCPTRGPARLRRRGRSAGTVRSSPATTSSATAASRRPARRSPRDALDRQHPQREARVAEQADGDAGRLDRREERHPVDREHDAVEREPGARASERLREGRDERERDRRDRGAPEHDRDGRPREPGAEQPGHAEQRDGDVQRQERGGGSHRGSPSAGGFSHAPALHSRRTCGSGFSRTPCRSPPR